jgi:outer membrane protein OmpA-like peptidoglycan-associated protein
MIFATAQVFGGDEEGPRAAENPYFTKMPGYRTVEDRNKAFDAFGFWNGKKAVTVEGKRWETDYDFDSESKRTQASDLQIRRNYANAVRTLGGTVIFDGEGPDGQLLVGKVTKGDREIWLQVSPFNEGNDYMVVVIEKETMRQEVEAAAILDSLRKDGRIALYINFDTGKATLRPDARPVIDEIAKALQGDPSLRIRIDGHTDNVGQAAANKKLAEDRARAVLEAVAGAGVDRKRLAAAGFGADKPISDNKTEEGRAKNRRVELVKQ